MLAGLQICCSSCFPRKLVSFDPQHVTHFIIGKLIWVGNNKKSSGIEKWQTKWKYTESNSYEIKKNEQRKKTVHSGLLIDVSLP